jgi:hypothetical protein
VLHQQLVAVQIAEVLVVCRLPLPRDTRPCCVCSSCCALRSGQTATAAGTPASCLPACHHHLSWHRHLLPNPTKDHHLPCHLPHILLTAIAGIGGGDQWGGVEKNVENVAKNPFWGLWAQYATRADPWSIAENAAYRKELYKEYIRWLSMGTGPQVKVSHVFTWSGGSWDVLGTHYSSTAEEGSFRDDEIFKWVADHNAKVNGAVKSSAEVQQGA